MGDVYCRICGEPWDCYGLKHGDVTIEELDMILRGRGCPCCKDKVNQRPGDADHTDKYLQGLLDLEEDASSCLYYM